MFNSIWISLGRSTHDGKQCEKERRNARTNEIEKEKFISLKIFSSTISIYLWGWLTMVVWLVVLTIGGSRRRKMICPIRVSNGGGEEEVVEGVLRSVRWSFAVTHDGHVEIILPRRCRDFFGNMDGLVVIVVAAVVVAVDAEEDDVLLLFNVVIAVGW